MYDHAKKPYKRHRSNWDVGSRDRSESDGDRRDSQHQDDEAVPGCLVGNYLCPFVAPHHCRPRCLVAFLPLLGARCRSELCFTDRCVCAGDGRLEDGTGSREEGDSPLRPATPQDDILGAAVFQIPTQ